MPRFILHSRHFAAVVLCVSAAACSGPSAPSPPPPIALTCPAPSTVASAGGVPIEVTYTLPVASGGTAPITTACTPPSGSTFPIGSTMVECTAVDSRRQSSTCGFTVTVTAPPQVLVTRYIAFGDSITEGFPQPIRPALVDPPPDGSYPLVLQMLLRERYTAQTIDVLDEGVGGEIVANGVERLPGVLTSDAGGALLLMEGANDLNQFGTAGVDMIVSGLRQMIRIARTRQMSVFVGTLLPERASGKAKHPELVAPTNDGIRSIAAAEGAPLVDLFAAFDGVPDPSLISSDGLHPTAAGNQKIAEAFFSAIRDRLESPSTPFAPARTVGPRNAGRSGVAVYHR